MRDNETLEKIRKITVDKNFDNDVVDLIDSMRRYRKFEENITMGSNTYTGSIVEFIFATIEVIDGLAHRIVDLEDTVAVLSASQCSCDKEETVSVRDEEVPVSDFITENGPMQLDIEGGETPVEKLPAPKPEAKKNVGKAADGKKK